MATTSLRSRIHDLLPERVRRRHWVNFEMRTGEPELRLVPQLLGSSGILVDAGANTGIYAALALQLGRHVVAFEPVPEEAEQLRRMVGGRGVVNQVALSDRVGVAALHIPRLEGKDITARATLEEGIDQELPHRSIDVRVATLDSFFLQDVALLKIDVEGHEAAVLRGSAGTLARTRPNVIIEVEEPRAPGSVADVCQMMASLGYVGYWLDHGDLRSVDQFDPAVQQARRPLHGEALNGYVSNLLWAPAERPLQ